MDLSQLPDLSDWRYVEVWNVEEAALLWAAVDPALYPDMRLEQLIDVLPLAQYKKAWVSRKAFSEAICQGTLPFVEAWELRSRGPNGDWEMKIEFPQLPSARRLIHHMTRVSQAALLKWAKSKLPSYRADLQRVECSGRQQTLEREQTIPKPLALPNYTTPALELLAVHIEENLAGVPEDQRPTPAEQREWLKQQAVAKGLGRREHEAIYMVARSPDIKQRAMGERVHPENEQE